MKIKNVEKSSTVDYPPYISAVVFLSGCNFRCPFCYNKELVDENSSLPDIPKDEFLTWLTTRQGKLDAVVITGGEPTIHGDDLINLIKNIKDMGFKVKLDTNGSNPQMIKTLLNRKLIDYIAMDVKSDMLSYDKASGVQVNMFDINTSINMIMNSGILYEFRTTVIPGIHGEQTLQNIGQWIKGSRKYALQQFKPINTLDPTLEKVKPYSEKDFEDTKKIYEELKIAAEIEFRR
jgi:pyruvate formate lyase activating enzyme